MRAALYPLIRPLLFRLDPERAHRGALRLSQVGSRALEAAARAGLRIQPPTSSRLERHLLGLRFPNPIGLAAGFDKDGLAAHLWPSLGFGFAELGTVTGRAQEGNPRPRIFRLPEDGALINRLGFNSQGCLAVARRLESSLVTRPLIPIGVNIGASRDTVGDELRELEDYRLSTRELGRLADYVVLNVSSPNTPGLRDLQRPLRLARLVGAVRREIASLGLGITAPPIVVKLSPDLDEGSVAEVCRAALEAGAAGFVATNTTVSRMGCRSTLAREPGGLSGKPLRSAANRTIAQIRAVVGRDVPIIGVGGVQCLDHVLEKLAAGADLVALYSGLVFAGPLLARHLALALDDHLMRGGIASAADLVGRTPTKDGSHGGPRAEHPAESRP